MTTVMVVDDDDDIRITLIEILVDEGYQVYEAANGKLALDLLRSSPPPQVILLDLMMPGMNGWDFRAEQCQDPALAHIPVILVSGGGDVQAHVESLQASGYLTKPFRLDRLLDTVERFRR